MIKKITAKSNIIKVLEDNPKTVEIFAKYGLPCVGCAMAHFESIGDITAEFGLDEKKLLKELNKVSQKK